MKRRELQTLIIDTRGLLYLNVALSDAIRVLIAGGVIGPRSGKEVIYNPLLRSRGGGSIERAYNEQ